MKVSYKKMWVKCAEKEINQADLRKLAGISPGTFTRIRKNEEVSLTVLMKIAEILECNAGELMDFIKDET